MEIRNESSSERIIMESPDELAADYIEGFEVTSDMPENYSSAITQQSNRNSTRNENSCHLRFTPKKLTQKITKSYLHIRRHCRIHISRFETKFGKDSNTSATLKQSHL